MTKRVGDVPPGTRTKVSNSQGVQIGDGNCQINMVVNQHGAKHAAELPIIGYHEPAYRETLRVISGRTKGLRDRQLEIEMLKGFASGDDTWGANGYLWIVGAPWAGKTALLAEAVQILPSVVDDLDVVAYFLIARESQASQEQFLAAVVPQLASLLGIDSPSEIDLHVFRDLWARAVALTGWLERRLLLVVDGLDEDLRHHDHSVAALLPTEHLDDCARVLVSSRPYPEISVDVDSSHPLRTAPIVRLASSPHALKIHTSAQQEVSILLSSRSGNASASDLPFSILGLMTAAVGALSVNDLSAMLTVKRRIVREFLARRAARSVEPVGIANEQRYQFAHQTLLEFCQEHPDVGGDPEYLAVIHGWANSWEAKAWPSADMSDGPTPSYLLDSYPAMLIRNRIRGKIQPELLVDLVTDLRWIDTSITNAGIDSVLASLRDASQTVENPKPINSILRVVETQAQHFRDKSETSTGWTATCLAWSALRHEHKTGARDACTRLYQHHPPWLQPLWTNSPVVRDRRNLPYHEKGAIRALAVMPGDCIISGGSVDGSVRQWNPHNIRDSGRKIGRHEGVVLTVAITDGGFIASGGIDGSVRLWDPANPRDGGRELGRHRGRVRALAVTLDGLIVAGDQDGAIRMWDPAAKVDVGYELGRHSDQVRALAAMPSGQVVSGSLDGSLRLWDLACRNRRNILIGSHKAVTDVAAISERHIISVGLYGTVRLWDLDSNMSGYRELEFDHFVRSVAIDPDGRVLLGCADGSLGLWDPVTSERGVRVGSHPGSIMALAAGVDGRIFTANDRVITMFKLTATNPL